MLHYIQKHLVRERVSDLKGKHTIRTLDKIITRSESRMRIYKRKTTEEFVSEAISIHGNQYQYHHPYVHSRQKIGIECPIHGVFFQTPYSHLEGSGCKQCDVQSRARQNTYTHSTFIQKAKDVHGSKYEYDEYVHSNTPLKIICKVHGEFEQKPYVHLLGHGCKQCADDNRTGGYTLDWFEYDSQRYNLPGTFYILNITSPEKFFKIGITNNLPQRLTHYPKILQYKVLTSIDMLLYNAFILEQQILTTLKEYKHYSNMLFSGHTECLRSTQPVKKFLTEYVNNSLRNKIRSENSQRREIIRREKGEIQ